MKLFSRFLDIVFSGAPHSTDHSHEGGYFLELTMECFPELTT